MWIRKNVSTASVDMVVSSEWVRFQFGVTSPFNEGSEELAGVWQVGDAVREENQGSGEARVCGGGSCGAGRGKWMFYEALNIYFPGVSIRRVY